MEEVRRVPGDGLVVYIGSPGRRRASLYVRSGQVILRALLSALSNFSDGVPGSAVCQTGQAYSSSDLVRAVPEIILRGATFFSDPSTPRTNMESEPPDPQDT